jgi:parallel beta-helix repeat protein
LIAKIGVKKMNDTNDRMIFIGVTAILALFFVVMVSMGASATTIYVPEGGNQTIQQAVNNATAGDEIVVRDAYTGTKENIDVNVSHLKIRSENGSLNCTVEALNSNDHVFNVTTDYVNISGLMVQNATNARGIRLLSADHCNVSGNNVSYNYCGIELYSSSSNTLTNNNVSYNVDGIWLDSSSSNTLTNNNVSYNDHNGIALGGAGANTFSGNNVSNNYNGIGMDSSSGNTFSGNNVSNNYYGISPYNI